MSVLESPKKKRRRYPFESKMKIITVNLTEATIARIHVILEEYHDNPSRSELVRVAVRLFLEREVDKILKGDYPKERYFPTHMDMRTVRFCKTMEAIEK